MEPQTLALLAVTSIGMTVGFVLLGAQQTRHSQVLTELGAQQARHSQVLTEIQTRIAILDAFRSAARWLLTTPRCYFFCKAEGDGESELLHVEADDEKGAPAFRFCRECGREKHSDFESARQQLDGFLEFRDKASWLLISRCFICCKAEGEGARRLAFAHEEEDAPLFLSVRTAFMSWTPTPRASGTNSWIS